MARSKPVDIEKKIDLVKLIGNYSAKTEELKALGIESPNDSPNFFHFGDRVRKGLIASGLTEKPEGNVPMPSVITRSIGAVNQNNWEPQVKNGDPHGLRALAIVLGYGPHEDWLTKNNQTEADLWPLEQAGKAVDYWKDHDDDVWTAFAGWNGPDAPRGKPFIEFANALADALETGTLKHRPTQYVIKAKRNGPHNPFLSDPSTAQVGAAPADPTDNRTSDAMGRLLSLKQEFLSDLDDIPPEMLNHMPSGTRRRVAEIFEEIEAFEGNRQLNFAVELQTEMFKAVHETPDNPLVERLHRGAAVGVNHALKVLIGRGIQDPSDGAGSDLRWKVPRGNYDAKLLADIASEAEKLAEDQQLNLRQKSEVRCLRRAAEREAECRDVVDGMIQLDIAALDRAAWPVRQMYLGALRRIEDTVSEIVAMHLDRAPPLAIFRDQLWNPESPPPEVEPLLDQLPASAVHYGPEMVVIPKGRFMMGAPDDDPEGQDIERPQHEVQIERSFALARFPITNGAYFVFATLDGRGSSSPEEKDPNLPRVQFRFNPANDYAKWLSDMTGQRYRLPSEAEWEYAARARQPTRYWWGDEWSTEMANGAKSQAGVTPLGTYRPNLWRLSDTLGNVREWCADEYQSGYDEPRTQVPFRLSQQSPDTLKLGDHVLEMPSEGSAPKRVLRGGSWSDNPQNLRSAYRSWDGPDSRISSRLGFRPARTLFTS